MHELSLVIEDARNAGIFNTGTDAKLRDCSPK
jgi:hypothetical protein